MSPVFHHVRLDDPESAAKHPALISMISDGWTVSASFVGERGGAPELVLLLSPPKKSEKPSRAFLSTTLATALGAAIGAIVALSAVSWIGI